VKKQNNEQEVGGITARKILTPGSNHARNYSRPEYQRDITNQTAKFMVQLMSNVKRAYKQKVGENAEEKPEGPKGSTKSSGPKRNNYPRGGEQEMGLGIEGEHFGDEC